MTDGDRYPSLDDGTPVKGVEISYSMGKIYAIHAETGKKIPITMDDYSKIYFQLQRIYINSFDDHKRH